MLPYPLMTVFLIVMWLLLNSFTLGHFVLGTLVAIVSSWALASLRPDKPKIGKWYLIPKLLGIVFYDIGRSNLAVAGVILRGRRKQHTSAFVLVPVQIQHPVPLALLAIILTSMPGSAWLEYDSRKNTILLHVLDLLDENEWVETIKTRYEKLLMEIFP